MNNPLILIVDDEPHMRRLVAFALRPLSNNMMMAGSGLEALRIMRDNPVALAVFDVNMKDVDGLNALREARETPALSKIPIILLTGAGETHIEEQALGLGAQAFFRKPFSPARLLEKARELLGLR